MTNQKSKSTETQAEVTTPGPGQQLRDERLRRDMTLEQIAEALHLDLKTVGHLEADEYQALPPLTFVQGYIRSYSQLLGIPPEPLLSRLADVAGDDGTSPLIPRAGTDSFGGSKPRAALRMGPGPLTLGLGIILLLGVLAAAGWWLSTTSSNLPFLNSASPDSSTDTSQSPAVTESASMVEETATSESASDVSAPDTTTESAADAALAESAEPPDSPAPAEPTVAQEPTSAMPDSETDSAEPASTTAEPAATTAPVDQRQSLLFRLNGDSWLEVTDAAGERLYFGMASTGEQQLAGEPPFDIVIGNTDSVELEFSGETIDLQPFARNKVARFTLGDS